MRSAKLLVLGLATAACVGVASTASAHGYYRGHYRGGGVVLGLGLGIAATYPYWAYPRTYYPYPYAPYYPPVVYAAPPVTYVEQQPAQAQPHPQPAPQAAPTQNPAGWWYYCAESRSYYPYVQQCAGAWQQVSPTPPGR